MTLDELHNAIRTRVKEQIQETLKVVTYYDNQPEAVPPSDLSKFVCASIRLSNNVKQHVGVSSSYRQEGVLILMVMCEGGKGDKPALEIASSCIAAFRSLSAGGVVYRTPSPEVVGINPNGWWQVNVTCPFYAETQQ